MKKSFGDLLRELREDNNISQQELADVLGVGRSAIGNYESGIRKPDMELLEAIADYFNVDMDYLYGKTDIKNSYRENLRSSNFPNLKQVFKDNLLKQFEAHKTPQAELAQHVGVSNSAVNNWARGISMPRMDKIDKICDFFGIQRSDLLTIKEPNQSISRFDNILPITTKKIPLLGDIACGEPIYADQDFESYVEVGSDMKADFALKAKGDSMIGARIQDGDIVFIRKQSIVENGRIAAVVVDGEATLKRVEYLKDQNILFLKPENPRMKTLVFTHDDLDEIQILGQAIAFQSDIK